jgi:hypothetical protein
MYEVVPKTDVGNFRDIRRRVFVSDVGQPAQCKWRPLIGQCEITAYVMSAGSSLSSIFILIAFVAFVLHRIEQLSNVLSDALEPSRASH